MAQDSLKIFALGSTRELGQGIAGSLGLTLAEHEEREFEDGEHKARPLESVRGDDVFVLHSLYSDPAQSVNDKLCRLLFFLGAVRDAGAGRVTAVVPYLGYARKDRKTKPRDPVTTRYVAGLFESVGVDRVMVLDVHNLAAFQNAFRCPTEHLEAGRVFAAHFAPLAQDRKIVVVSPDAGGVKRAERFRQILVARLDRPVGSAFLEKQRSAGQVWGDAVVGDVQGAVAVVVDDLISTGTTIARTVRACRARGAETVWAAATHGLFVGQAGEILDDPGLAQVAVTNTVPPFRLGEGALGDRLHVLDVAPLLGEAIQRLHTDGSMVELLQD